MKLRRVRSRVRPALAAVLALSLVVPIPVGATTLTRAQERELGKQVVRQVRHEFRLLDDPYLSAYLRTIGTRMADAMGAHDFDNTFHVVADPRINAFAVPGGHVFVTSQTILAVGDESELAGVVAHELGHVQGRHIARRMEKGTTINLIALAAVLAGAFLGGSPQLGAAVTSFGLAGAQTQMLRYSRQDEEDADRRAIRAMAAAHYDGWGMVRFMETLAKESPPPDGVPAYLFTHPLPENRASYLAAALPPQGSAPPPVTTGYLFRAKARVLVEDPRPWGEQFLRRRVADHPDDPSGLLGLGLLLRKAGRYGEALALHDRALAAAPDDSEIRHERAATALKLGRVDDAVHALEALRAEGNAPLPALRDLGWAYLESGRGTEAVGVYDEIAERDPDWVKLPYYRGMALGKAGQVGEGHAELGDYYRELGQKKLAKIHYRKALELLLAGDRRAAVKKALEKLGGEQPGDEVPPTSRFRVTSARSSQPSTLSHGKNQR